MPTILPAFSRACNKNVNHLAHPMYWPDHSQPALNANVMSSSVCDCSDAKVFVFSSSLWRLSQSGGSRQAFSERSLAITRADQVLLISCRSIQTSIIRHQKRCRGNILSVRNCADCAYFQGDMRENLKISSSAACVWILSKESGLSVSTPKMTMVF